MSMRRFEHKLAVGREREQKMDDLSAHINRDKVLKENFKSDDRADIQRTLREERDTSKEAYMSMQLQAAREAQERTHRLRAQDERLAVELTKRKVEASREAKNVQRICEQSEELRELEEKLKQAYLNKEREVQITESNVLMQKQNASDAHIAQEVETERQRGLMAEQYREYLRRQDGRAMKESLDEQMKEKVDRRTLAAEEFLREKAEVDAVVAAIEAEDDREKEAREAKEYQIRKHIEAFVAEKEKFKHVHAEQLEAEKEEIRDYAKQVMARETVTRMAREKDQNTKDEILGKLSADMAKRQLEADEMENLRNELVIQETEERIIIKEREKAERAEQNRRDIALANEYQRQLKAIKREEEKAEEDQFRRAMLDKFADDDRLDQLNEQKRRRKQMEHRKEIVTPQRPQESTPPLHTPPPPLAVAAAREAPSASVFCASVTPLPPTFLGRGQPSSVASNSPLLLPSPPPSFTPPSFRRAGAVARGAPRQIRGGARQRDRGAGAAGDGRRRAHEDHRGRARAHPRRARQEPRSQALAQGRARHRRRLRHIQPTVSARAQRRQHKRAVGRWRRGWVGQGRGGSMEWNPCG